MLMMNRVAVHHERSPRPCRGTYTPSSVAFGSVTWAGSRHLWCRKNSGSGREKHPIVGELQMSEQRRKTERILIRAEPEEATAIRERATAAGVSVPEFLRRSALSKRIDMRARTTVEALQQLARIGQNLNQMVRLAHIGQHNREDVLTTLAEVRAAAAALLGNQEPRDDF